MTVAYLEDSDSRKVNLGVGAYRTDESKPYILPVVTKIERELLEEGVDHEYAPIDGSAKFRQCVSRFIFGAESDALVEGRVRMRKFLDSRSSKTFILIICVSTFDYIHFTTSVTLRKCGTEKESEEEFRKHLMVLDCHLVQNVLRIGFMMLFLGLLFAIIVWNGCPSCSGRVL